MVRVSAFILLTVSTVSAFQAPSGLGFGAYRGSLAISRRACSNRACAASSLLMVSDAAAPLLTKAQEAKEATGASTKLVKALKKPTGAITVSIEYSSPDADMDTANSVDFRTLSAELRRGKNILILCDGSTERGIVDIKNFVKEQAMGKGKFPGPCPVVASGGPYTLEQAAEVKAAGADAFYMPAAEASKLMSGCLAIGLDPIVEVSSESDVDAAVAAGAKIISVHMGEDTEGMIALKEKLPEDAVAVAAISGRGFGGPASLFKKEEAETAEDEDIADILKAGFAVRDAKFNSIIVKKACVDSEDKEETTYAKWLVAQLNSKRSTAYSHLAKTSSPLGTGRPPAPLGGFTTVLEGSRPSHTDGSYRR